MSRPVTRAPDVVTAFKDAFREHPAGISLITAATPEGRVGLTASSVASVSVDPLALSFSVTRATGSAGAIIRSDSYLVHLLDHRHQHIAQQFSVTGGERFSSAQGWTALDTGEPYLPGVRAALRCRTLQLVPVGSSTLVAAEVLDIVSGESADPMVYHDRTFTRLSHPGS
ncbi:MAG: flavin reductase family protein [Micrococcaceae bacterium]